MRCSPNRPLAASLLAVALAACLAPAPALDLDPGGFSVAFPTEPRPRETIGENLIPDGAFEDAQEGVMPEGWSTGAFNIPVGRTDRHYEELRALSRETARFAQRGAAPDARSGPFSLRLATPPEIFDALGEHRDRWFRNTVSRTVALPESERDLRYLLRFWFQGVLQGGRNNRARVLMDFRDAAGERTRGILQQHFRPLADEWIEGQVEFVVPAATSTVRLQLHLDGAGDVRFDDLTLHRVPMERGVSARLMPFHFLDNVFALSQNDAGIMVIGFRQEDDETLRRPHVVLELPDGVEVLGVHDSARLVESQPVPGAPGRTRHRVEVARLARRANRTTYTVRRNAVAFVLRTALPPGGEALQGRYWLEAEGFQADPNEFDLRILPPVQAPAPKRFKLGAMYGSMDGGIAGDEALREHVGFYRRAGFNHVFVRIHGGPVQLADEFGRQGVYRYFQPFYIRNGFTIGRGRKPDEVAFQYVDGAYSSDGICPVAVYRRSDYYRDEVLSLLRTDIAENRRVEGVMTNWEPYMYHFKGCFCGQCKEEFAAYSDLPRAEVDRVWPEQVLQEHRNLWIRFRGWQHGQLVQTLEKDTVAIGREAGVRSHFAPEAAVTLFTPRWEDDDRWRQISALEWAPHLREVVAWGPYLYYRFHEGPYRGTISGLGRFLRVHDTSGDVRRYTRERMGPQPPDLFAFPHSYQGETWVTYPEALAFDSLIYFANAWEGVFPYVFPKGYDARYWLAMSNVAAAAAAFEDFTFDGQRNDRHAIEPASPLPDFDRSLLQGYEYELDGRRLVMVANYWARGEAFFRLSLQGLDPGRNYVLREPLAGRRFADLAAQPGENAQGRIYANAQGETAFSAEELAQGALLHAGALRFAFFVVEPAGPAGGDEVVLPNQMEEALRERLPALREVADGELMHARREREEEAEEAAAPDYAQLAEVRQGAVSCGPASWPGLEHPAVAFRSPGQELVVDPAGGGRIVSWTVGGEELAYSSGPWGMMLTGFWWPGGAVVLNRPFAAAVERTDGGLRLALERRVGGEAPELRGVTVRLLYDVAADRPGFSLHTEIVCPGDRDIEFSHRTHNMPAAFLLERAGQGYALLETPAGPERYVRQFLKRVFRYAPAPADASLDRLLSDYRMDSWGTIARPSFVFGREGSDLRVRLDLDPGSLYAVVLWDGGAMECSTFEPMSQRIRLTPGESWSTEAKWTVEP